MVNTLSKQARMSLEAIVSVSPVPVTVSKQQSSSSSKTISKINFCDLVVLDLGNTPGSRAAEELKSGTVRAVDLESMKAEDMMFYYDHLQGMVYKITTASLSDQLIQEIVKANGHNDFIVYYWGCLSEALVHIQKSMDQHRLGFTMEDLTEIQEQSIVVDDGEWGLIVMKFEV